MSHVLSNSGLRQPYLAGFSFSANSDQPDNTETIKIIDIIGDNLCIASDDAEKIYNIVYPLLKNGDKVELSFEGAEHIISSFLYGTVGELYENLMLHENLSEEEIRGRLNVTGLDDIDREGLQITINEAKRFAANPELHEIYAQAFAEYAE
jgi:hypothetical protein